MPGYSKCYARVSYHFHQSSCISFFCVSVWIQWQKQTHQDIYIYIYIPEVVDSSSCLLSSLSLYPLSLPDYLPSDFKLQHQTCRQQPYRDCLTSSYNCLRTDLCSKSLHINSQFSLPKFHLKIQLENNTYVCMQGCLSKHHFKK